MSVHSDARGAETGPGSSVRSLPSLCLLAEFSAVRITHYNFNIVGVQCSNLEGEQSQVRNSDTKTMGINLLVGYPSSLTMAQWWLIKSLG